MILRQKTKRYSRPNNFRLFLISLLALCMSTFLLFHFICIWHFGRLYVFEANKVILILETALIAGIVGFSAYSIVIELKETK